MGSAFAIRQHGQLLLLDVLRAFMDEGDVPPGWLKVLTDERLRPVLAERFRDAAGTPPLAYLTTWRMLLAQRELRSGEARVRSLALQLGCSSESAFSTASKREVGESPLHHRSRARQHAQQLVG